MKTVMVIIGALVLCGGIGLFALAVMTPSKYTIVGASAIQITQIYAEASFYAVLSIACFVFAGVLVYATSIPE